MKIRVISSKEEIDTLAEGEKMVHLTFRPSTDDIFFIVARCPDLEAFHIPTSYRRSISKTTETFLEMEGIAILEGEVGGVNNKDISDFSEIPQHIYDKIDQHLADGMSDGKIKDIIVSETSLSPDLIRFLITTRNQ